jgi:hypothetical protein
MTASNNNENIKWKRERELKEWKAGLREIPGWYTIEGRPAKDDREVTEWLEKGNRASVSRNIKSIMDKIILRASKNAKKSLIKARDWAIQTGYRSLTFVDPVPETYALMAMDELYSAYKTGLKNEMAGRTNNKRIRRQGETVISF